MPGLGGFGESIATLETARDTTNARRLREEARYNPIPIQINVSGAIDPQGTARTVKKVLDTARATTGVRVTAPTGFF